MSIAVQEGLLPGKNTIERFKAAQQLGFAGVEIEAAGLDERILDYAQAIDATGVRVAAVSLGQVAGYLSPEMPEREAAISRLREAMANAVDLLAEDVIFVPHFGAPVVPDLRPHRSALELETELMIWLLRTVSDLAYALGVKLHMQPRCRYETHFMTTPGDAIRFCKEIKDHEHIRIAPHTFHVAMEEAQPYAALASAADRTGYLNLADSNGLIPGMGLLDFAQVKDAIAGYSGWVTVSAANVSHHHLNTIHANLPECVALLQRLDF